MAFSLSNAGKALTSFNLLLFIGAFALQWIIGIIIDITMNFGFLENGNISAVSRRLGVSRTTIYKHLR